MGKSTIIYVIGLCLIIGIALSNINNSSLHSMDTYSTYFGRTMAHNIAVSAANVGSNYVLFNSTYATDFSGTFEGGHYDVIYSDSGLAHSYTKFMTVASRYNSGGDVQQDTVRAVFQRVIFSRYGWFTEQERNGYVGPGGTKGPYYGASDWKITGDSVFGYAHTNSKFNLAGRPYFDKKVTATNSPTLMTMGGVQDPFYNEGYEWGVSVSRDTANISILKSVANQGSSFAPLMQNDDVGLEFNSDGTARLRIPYNSGSTIDTTVPLGALSASNVIGVNAGDLHIKGTYKGETTVVAFKGTGSTADKGNVWIDGDVVASDNPRFNSSSDDMLGIVSERMAYITKDASRNSSTVLNIQAAIYCHDGEFTAQDFWTIPISGRVNLYGSITQQTAGSLGLFSSGSGLLNGFFYSIRHDPRFLKKGPPQFPFSSKFRLVAWWEN
jgi:hypothetical protein